MAINVDKFYIYKITFPYITERNKLNLITYNKDLQNIFDVSLINHKILIEKYKTGDKNEKVRNIIKMIY